jgi:hypothetical protein
MSRSIKVVTLIFVNSLGIAAVMPWLAEAANPSKADKAGLKRAIVACKAEAKGKKIKWLSRRKYVKKLRYGGNEGPSHHRRHDHAVRI